MHRALVSLQEELEAVDWYQQRADATSDEQLRAILLHNMRDEMEHACMVLEWIRRQSESMDEQLKTYLFTKEPITEIEEEHEGDEGGAWRNPDNGTFVKQQPVMRLTVGSLKGK